MSQGDSLSHDELYEEVIVLLIRDLHSGFDLLVDRYDLYVQTVVRNILGNDDVADIVQESFLRAYLALKAYDPEKLRTLKVLPWIRMIAKNTALNYRAYESKRQAFSIEVFLDDGGQLVASKLEETESLLVRFEIIREVDSWLMDLSHHDRYMLVWHYWKGAEYARIARDLKMSPDAVRKRCERALMHARKVLTAKFGNSKISELLNA